VLRLDFPNPGEVSFGSVSFATFYSWSFSSCSKSRPVIIIRPLQASSGSSLFKNLSIKRLSVNIMFLDWRFLSPTSISRTSFALILHPVIFTTSILSLGFMKSLIYFGFSSVLPFSTSIISCSINLEFLNKLSTFFSSGLSYSCYLGIGTWIEKVIIVFLVTGISFMVI